jgi:hypothetical protein
VVRFVGSNSDMPRMFSIPLLDASRVFAFQNFAATPPLFDGTSDWRIDVMVSP